ncbi:MAG TPA: family 43 glycosylhydrolase [Vicinamibacterales bacterium]|nr:family 43 glycosylhydrolase [Vicinamibacterales bacterium]
MHRSALVVLASVAAFVPLAGLADVRSVRAAQTGGGTYANPVLPGDYPDPSVIRVGTEYWATATTSQWAPIFPLLRSQDLVNWEQVGSVFQSPPAWSAGSYWAPEIVSHGGRFFVYYTARKKDGPLCVAVADAPAPGGPYTDHGPLVCQEVGSIDAAAVTDENGQRYLVWKEDGNSRRLPTPLWARPLSDDGLRLTGEPREIFRNEAPWEAHLVEGPYLLRRDGWFYMFYSADACCGRRCNYKLGVARSRKLLGPWERNPGNPILAANDDWKCPGHGTIVDTPSGLTYLLYHAYHPVDFQYVGRQGLLDQVTWGADGWPAINAGRGPSASAPLPPGASLQSPPADVSDDFAAGALDPRWLWPWDQTPAPRVEDRRLHLRTGSHDIAVAARQTTSSAYTATALLDVRSVRGRAGLAAFGNRGNLIAATLDSSGNASPGRLNVSLWTTRNGETTVLASDTVGETDQLHFRVEVANGNRFGFSVSTDGNNWRALSPAAEREDLPPWDLGVRAALIVAGADGAAAFSGFTLRNSRPAGSR